MLKILSLSLFFILGEHSRTVLSTNPPTSQQTHNRNPAAILDTIALPDAHANEHFLYQIKEDHYFEDADRDELSLIVEYSSGPDFRNWLQFNSSNNIFSGKPSCSDVDSYGMNLTAKDGKGGYTSLPATITVKPSPDCTIQPADILVICTCIIGFCTSVLACSFCIHKYRKNRIEKLAQIKKDILYGRLVIDNHSATSNNCLYKCYNRDLENFKNTVRKDLSTSLEFILQSKMTPGQFSVLELLREDFLIPFEQLDKFDQLSLREIKKMIDNEGDILVFLGKEISTKSSLLP